MDNIKYSTKNLRPIAFISGVLLLVVFVVYFFDKPKDDYKPAVISNQPSSTWSQTIEINAGDVEPLPPVVQYPTHYHITANKPIYVTSTHAQRKRKIGSGEIVCLMQDIWNGREEAMITVEGIENQTTVKLGIFTEHTSSGILDQTKSKNLLEPRTTDENSPAVSVIDEQLIGRWLGEVNKKPAILIFSKQGESLKGKLTYDGIEETLSISIQEDPSQNEIILTLEGISYNRLRGRGNFYLDTFSGILKASSDQISGNFEDRAGTKGKWSVSKCINSPHNNRW